MGVGGETAVGAASGLPALVPRTSLHLIRFHGVLAPNAGLRAAVVPGPPEKPGEPAGEHAHGVRARMGLVRIAIALQDMDAARAHLQLAYEIAPNDPEVVFTKGLL